ncbi:MAG TPA: protein kinase [Candidatus Limnocylindria bacterium]|nr:protein kinase [Candidatus Limnocylindria bacterium]
MAPRDVFISHSSGDAESARELRAVLEAAGYTCWMAPDDIVGTNTWTEQILAAIAESQAMVVLVSSASNKSPHVSREVNLALGRKRAVLPIRIEAVEPEGPLEYLLSLVQHLDAFPPPISNHRDRILKRLEPIVRTAADRSTDTTPVATAPAPAPAPVETVPDETARVESPTPGSLPEPESLVEPAPAHERLRPTDIGPGTVVGAFMIESQLGEGGMATVYRARQEEPRRLVALKVIRADHAANAAYRRRFLEEKETLAALEHPGIVPIYAAGEADGVLYIAMRLVDGPDLQARIKRQGKLSIRETVAILEPIADAVDYAHAMGVVHRDLKPSNIILDRDGRPYLTDFGLGKRLEVDTGVSLPGMAIGTLDFMAPEQFTGASDPDLAPAIDLYALGCVVFQCLTGQPPFVRATPDQLMYAHAHEVPPSVRSLRPEYPPVIDQIFNKVLAKDPAARFGSAREFVAALDAVAEASQAGLTSPVVPTSQATPAAQARRWFGANTTVAVAGGAVALVLAVIVLAGSVFNRPGPTTAPTQAAVVTVPPTVTPAPTIPPPTPPPPTAPPASGPGTFPNAAEQQLLDLQELTDVVVSTCTRFEDRYDTALAMIQCDPPNVEKWDRVVFFVLYPDASTMATDYEGIMSNAGVAKTTTGCFDLDQANNVWSFLDEAGKAGPQQGLLGCYPRTEDTVDGVEYVWTFDDLKVMGLWLSPGYQEGLDYYNDWVVAVRPS